MLYRIFFLTLILLSCDDFGDSENLIASGGGGKTYRTSMGNGFATDWFKGSKVPNGYTPASLQKTLLDLKAKGFSNLRLRSSASKWGFADKGEEESEAEKEIKDGKKFIPARKMDVERMQLYLAELEHVVDAMISEDMFPVISWLHHHAEGRANQQDGDNFVAWWTAVAERLKYKSPNLAFNLMTEVGKQDDDGDGVYGVHEKTHVYNDWTARAIEAIRATGANNALRIIIITAPQNTKEESLSLIDPAILKQPNLMIEYHSYAAGVGASGRNPWNERGSKEERKALTDRLDALARFTAETGIPFYWGAWMAKDNNFKSATQVERDSFAQFFAEQLKAYGVPWSMNKLESFYDYKTNEWITDADSVDRTNERDKPYRRLQKIVEAMR